ICLATVEPIERAALFAKASTSPSRRPPRGPVEPNSTSPSEPSTPPPEPGAGAAVPPPAGGARRARGGAPAPPAPQRAPALRARHGRVRDQPLALLGRDRPDPAGGREDEGALRDRRRSPLVEERDQRLSHRELADRLLEIEPGIRPHCLRGRVHRLLIARREGAQRVLDAVAELAEHLVGDVERAL